MKTSLWPPRVLVYSAFADDHLAIMGAIAGADGILAKQAGPDELSDAVDAVARGENLLPQPSPVAMGAIAGWLDSDDLPILGMLLNGVPAHEIAPTLGIAEDWMTARRVAMLDRLRERPARRGASSD
jgi:DNA-binding NarL/FixJ family response regulator